MSPSLRFLDESPRKLRFLDDGEGEVIAEATALPAAMPAPGAPGVGVPPGIPPLSMPAAPKAPTAAKPYRLVVRNPADLDIPDNQYQRFDSGDTAYKQALKQASADKPFAAVYPVRRVYRKDAQGNVVADEMAKPRGPAKRFKTGDEAYLAAEKLKPGESMVGEFPVRRVYAREKVDEIHEQNLDTSMPIMYHAGSLGATALSGAAAGTAALGGTLARMPNLAYNLYTLPSNAFFKIAGLEDQVKENPKLFEDEAKWWDQFSARIRASHDRWDSRGMGFFDVLKTRDPDEIAHYMAAKMGEMAPATVIPLAIGAAGAPGAAMLAAGTTSASQELGEVGEMTGDPVAATSTALANGVFEGLLERSPAVLSKWAKALEGGMAGVPKAEIMKRVGKLLFSSAIQEGPVEEGLTELAQSGTRALTGVDPNAMEGVTERMALASTLGAGMGVGMTSPAAAAVGLNAATMRRPAQVTSEAFTDPETGRSLRFVDQTPSEAETAIPEPPRPLPVRPIATPGPIAPSVGPQAPPSAVEKAKALPPVDLPEPEPDAPEFIAPAMSKKDIEAVYPELTDEDWGGFAKKDVVEMAKMLHMAAHNDFDIAIGGIERFILDNDGFRPDPDKKEEFRDVPLYLRGKMIESQMRQKLIDAGFDAPDDLSRWASDLKRRRRPKSVDSFYAEAIFLLGQERSADLEEVTEMVRAETPEILQVREQGAFYGFNNPDVNARYEDLRQRGLKAGMTPAQARAYALKRMTTPPEPREPVAGAPRQQEFGVPGGVQGFGRGPGELNLGESSAKYDVAGPIFYHQIQRVITDKMPNSAPAAMVRNLIDPAKGNVKAEEVEWSGINEFLEGKEKVSKAELLDFLKQNQVEVKEVVKGQPEDAAELDALANKRKAGNATDEENKRYEELALRLFDRGHKPKGPQETKFSNYQLPGGKNYREVLLTLPTRQRYAPKAEVDKLMAERPPIGAPENEMNLWRYKVIVLEKKYGANQPELDAYQSTHFDEPNIIAHVRMNDRTTADGKKVLFLEEVQSDWHQKGRKIGFKGQQEVPKVEDVTKTQIQVGGQWYHSGNLWGKPATDFRVGDPVPQLVDKDKGVLNAPFKKTWHELALKRMLRYAVDNGYDGIAWTTGEQQAERYDLAKQVDEIAWEKTKDGKVGISVIKGGDVVVVEKENLDQNQLADTVGKDLARKILESVKEKDSFSGLDLKVGGEGMKGFYDQIIPAFLNKYTKKWGGRVGETVIEIPGNERHPDSDPELVDDDELASLGNMFDKKEVIHYLEITPAMRGPIQEGLPLFEKTANYDANANQLELELKSTETPEGKKAKVHMMAPMAVKYRKIGSVTFKGEQITGPADVAWAMRMAKKEAKERLWIVGLKGNKVVGVEMVHLGMLDQANISLFEISSSLQMMGADGLYWVHNHPSGTPEASPEDVNAMREIDKLADVLGVRSMGGVIIDDVNFGYIPPHHDGPPRVRPLTGKTSKAKNVPVPVNELYVEWTGAKEGGPTVSSPNDVAQIVKGWKTDLGSVMVVLMDTKNRVRRVIEMPMEQAVNVNVLAMEAAQARSKRIALAGSTGPPDVRTLANNLSALEIELLDFVQYEENSGSVRSNRDKIAEGASEYGVVRISEAKQKALPFDLPNGGILMPSEASAFKRWWREWMTTDRGVGTKIDQMNEERLGQILKTAFDAPLTGRAIKTYLKMNDSEDLHTSIYDALLGRRAITDLPEDIQPTVRRAREDVDALSKALAANATMGDAMRQTILRNLGFYMGRYYKLFEVGPKAYKPTQEVIDKAKLALRELYPRTLGGMSDVEMDGVIKAILERKSFTFFRGERKIDIPQNHFIRRKNLPKEIRDLYGEIKDPAYLYVKTVADLSLAAENAKFLGQISQVPGAFTRTPDVDHYVRVPDEARWGRVAGLYTTPQIMTFLRENIELMDNPIMRFLEHWIADPYKATKTIFSVPTQVRNFLGNIAFSVLAGTEPWIPRNAKYYQHAFDILTHKTGAKREEYKDLIAGRVVETQYFGTDMPKFLREVLADPVGWTKILDTVKGGVNAVGEIYNAVDAFYRVAAFLKYRDQGLTIPQAAAKVDLHFANYHRLPKAARVGAKWAVLGPFMSFKVNAGRILLNSFRAGIGGDKTQMMRLMFVVGLIPMMAALMKDLHEVDDDETDKLEGMLPPWRRTGGTIYFRDANGALKAFDLGYIWPTGDFQKAATAIARQDPEAFMDAVDLFQHPLLEFISIMAANYDPSYRRPISSGADPWPRQVADRIAEVIRRFYVPASSPIPSIAGAVQGRIEPGLLTGYQIKNMMDAYHGVTDRWGRTKDLDEELRGFITGIRTWTVRPQDIRAAYVRRQRGMLAEEKRDFERFLRSRNISPVALGERRKIYQQRVEQISKNMREAVE